MSEKDEERELAIEALAEGRNDLVDEYWQTLFEEDQEFRREVVQARALSLDMGLLMKPDADSSAAVVRDLVARAMEVAPAPLEKRHLRFAVAASALLTTASLALSWSARGINELWGFGRSAALAVQTALSFVPDYAGALAVLAAIAAVGVFFPLRRWLAFAVLLCASSASAQCFEGDWSDAPEVDVPGGAQLRSEALLEAAEDADLQLISILDGDPSVTVRAEDMPLRTFLARILPEDAVARLEDDALMLRNGECARTRPAPTPPPTSGARDRVVMGEDVHVAADEVVSDIFTMGGDARIEGTVLGDVVTMGGDVEVLGTVQGDVATMGGDVHAANGIVHGQIITMGGDSDVQTSAPVEIENDDEEEDSPRRDFFRRLARHGMIFLLGALLLGAFRERHARLCSAVIGHPLRTAGLGISGLTLAAVVIIACTLTLVGIPLAIAITAGVVIAIYAGFAVLASVIGALLPVPKWQGRPLTQLGAGVAVLFLLSFLPVVGGLTNVLAALLGFGAFVATRFRGEN